MEIYWHISSHLFWKPSRGGLRGAGSLQARLPASWNYLHRRRGRHEGAQRGHTQHLRTSAGREWASSEPAPCGSTPVSSEGNTRNQAEHEHQWAHAVPVARLNRKECRSVGVLTIYSHRSSRDDGSRNEEWGTGNGTLDAFLHCRNENVPAFPFCGDHGPTVNNH